MQYTLHGTHNNTNNKGQQARTTTTTHTHTPSATMLLEDSTIRNLHGRAAVCLWRVNPQPRCQDVSDRSRKAMRPTGCVQTWLRSRASIAIKLMCCSCVASPHTLVEHLRCNIHHTKASPTRARMITLAAIACSSLCISVSDPHAERPA